ncbi:SpoIIE family protein phosphatase [Streptomyces sp. NPDC026673]|uniref:SpoIIE family protein phosphatase n=1 Tax=Streptomyces sp. NPDC026673 TaxID=3155724 RepID=UPI0033DCBBCF
MRMATAFADECWADLEDSFGRMVHDTGGSAGLLYLSVPGGQVQQLAMITGASRRIAAPWTRVATDLPSPVTDAIRERRLVWLASRQEMACRYPNVGLVVPYDFMLAAVPIIHGTSAWGGSALLWPQWHASQLDPREREVISAFCHHAGQLLQQAADRGEPLLPRDDPQVLAPMRTGAPRWGEALAAVEFSERLPIGCCALDLDGRVTFVNTAAAGLLGTGATGLMGTRPWESLPWLHQQPFEDRYRAAVLSREPTTFTALRPPDHRLSFRLYPDACGISVHITPARAGPANITGPAGRPLAEPAAIAGHYQLMHLAATLTQAAGTRDVVELVADQLVPGFGARGLVLMMIEEGRLRIIGHRGYTSEFIDRYDGATLASLTPPAQALAGGVPSFFVSFADFQRAYPDAARYGSRDAWAFLPLITSGRPVGTLVLSYDQPRPFPQAERAALAALAGLIGQALDRARLYDTQHQLAHSLQNCLLPRELPSVPGLEVAARYRQAGRGMEVGGDFYDLIRCDSKGAAAVIGDVQGHNVSAAALMGQIRAAIHSHAIAGPRPDEVLLCANRLIADLDPGLFTSCLYVHLDLHQHRAHLSTAGHLPPLIRHPDGHTEILRLSPGLLLGIEPDADYTTAGIPLSPGTVLALYTDGLVETPGTDIDDAITDLADHLARTGDQTTQSLADTLVEHATRTTPGTDDMALLLVRATD